MDIVKQLKHLSDQLGLNFESQDWGIINADPTRTNEFIAYLEANADELSPQMQYQLYELILASFNDDLVDNGPNPNTDQRIQQFVDGHRENETFRSQFGYWGTLEDEGEFPIAPMLKIRA